MLKINKIHQIDALKGLKELPDQSVDMVITSPPYWGMRDFGFDGQIGLEPSFNEYLNRLWTIFDQVKRVLRQDGTCWINLDDTYGRNRAGLGAFNRRWNKGMLGIPERFILGMLDRGWTLRNKIIWHKPNHMPSSVKDRFTCSWEYLYLLTKSDKYYFDLDDVRVPHKSLGKINGKKTTAKPTRLSPHIYGNRLPPQPGEPNALHVAGKNPGDCWEIGTRSYSRTHFAVFPEKLIERPVKITARWICRKCQKPSDRCCGAGAHERIKDQSWSESSMTAAVGPARGQMDRLIS